MSSTESNDQIQIRKQPSPLRIFLALFLIFGTLISLWSLATPLMAFPDEPAHTIKAAAVVRGQVTIQPGTSFGHGIHVKVPAYIANLPAQGCYKFRSDTSAGCAPAVFSNDSYETIGVTSAGSYNPLYYWIVGLPTLVLNGAPALYAMRIISALACAAFFAASFTALTQLKQPKIPVILATIAMTPMVLFMSSGINPNSIEIAATMAAFSGFLVLLDRFREPRKSLPAVAAIVISTIALANNRQVSLVWLLCAIIVAFMSFPHQRFLRLFKNRYVLWGAGISIPAVLLGVFWIFLMLKAPPSTGVAPEGIVNLAPGVRPYQAFLTMIDRSFDFVSQYIGNMGWLDTPTPQAVFLFWSMLLMISIFLPIVIRPFRRTLGYWVALGLLLVVPAIMQASQITTLGYIWQGRYNLPLFFIVLISVGMAARFIRIRENPILLAVSKILGIGIIVAQTLAFAYVLRRYVVGLRDGNWQTMITKPDWQPPLGWVTLTILFLIAAYIGINMLYKYLYGKSLVSKISRQLVNEK